jgi:hypothetical protein
VSALRHIADDHRQDFSAMDQSPHDLRGEVELHPDIRLSDRDHIGRVST